MNYTQQTFGRGDGLFRGVIAHMDAKKHVVAIEIGNVTTGSVLYAPDASLLRVLAGIKKIDDTHAPTTGELSAFMANELKVNQSRFFLKGSEPKFSTSTIDGSNHAMSEIHRALIERGLVLDTRGEIALKIKADKEEAMQPKRITPHKINKGAPAPVA